MRETWSRNWSFWTFLLTMFLAVGTAVAILPGCGDDSGSSDDTDTFRDSYPNGVDK